MTEAAFETPRYGKRGSWQLGPALVWRRRDFRETSRLITLLTREQGLLHTLAKGAHRPESPFMGRIDFLNSVEPKVSRRGDPLGLRQLHSVRLLHEPRGLRDPDRYLAAAHLADFATTAFPPGRADPPVFDLVQGGIRLLERCPKSSLPAIMTALETRFLALLGQLPALGEGPEDDRVDAPAGPRRLDRDDRRWLLAALRLPGRTWDRLPAPSGAVLAAVGAWLGHATERRAPLRPLVFGRGARRPVTNSSSSATG